MSVRSVINKFNRIFLVCGFGSINYNHGNIMTTIMCYVLRFIYICTSVSIFYYSNKWAVITEAEMSELTSLIMICCVELILIGKCISHMWRIFFDSQLSMVLTKIETIHEKLIRLNVVGPMKIKMNWFSIIFIIVNGMIIIIIPIIWIIVLTRNLEIIEMVIMVVLHTLQCAVFSEYILLILYIQWIVFMINEQIMERRSCLSTFRDMYLEVIECLTEVNKSIFGLPGIVVFIAANLADIILMIYSHILFPRDYTYDPYFAYPFIRIFLRTVNISQFYAVGDVTEKEVNRMSLILHQRSVIEKNPRIKRQIKMFLLRRLHEHFHFQLYGVCHINLRQLISLSKKAIGYLVIQTLFKLNNN